MDWYYALGNEQRGPVSEDELRGLARAGTVTADTLVWREGMTDWLPYSDAAIPGATMADPLSAGAADPFHIDAPAPETIPSATRTGVCAECGRGFPVENMVSYAGRYVCGDCKDRYFQRVREGAALPAEVEYAGFWIRFVAKVIDGFITGVVGGLIAMPFLTTMESETASAGAVLFATLAYFLANFGVPLVYYTGFVGRFGATPGKMALGLVVVRPGGGSVSYLRAAGRFFAEILSSIILGIGYIMAAFDDEKRALHDHICDTRVVKKSSLDWT